MRKKILLLAVGLAFLFGCDKPVETHYSATIHYVPLYLEYYAQQSCSDIQRKGTLVALSRQAADSLVAAVEAAELIRMPEFKEIDVRICCIMVSSTGDTVHTLAFEQPPLMQLDGLVYRQDSLLFSRVTSYLPADSLRY